MVSKYHLVYNGYCVDIYLKDLPPVPEPISAEKMAKVMVGVGKILDASILQGGKSLESLAQTLVLHLDSMQERKRKEVRDEV